MINAEGTHPDDLDASMKDLPLTALSLTPFRVILKLPDTRAVAYRSEKNRRNQRGVGQYNFSIGLNFSNVVYFGMGIGFHQLQMDKYATHTELDTDQNDFSRFLFAEDLEVTKWFGMNMGDGETDEDHARWRQRAVAHVL